ncbi:hypothetical protein [Micromonospora sagamiensis]|uniref:UDP-N-acetylglucosamine 1-carboxyvinyltransferase n=1 Tax=Micromonospora sagamiensis TaxID=47875 RepID=A0A562WKW1_9ACTN|nr:hypothetical protein [Micromonospora sagamiensis]TWJ30933.1 UDP-N-acetylglucosamine 1-carboxyvinyltransferase [Micromonospora sagamiensis]BCL16026.1 hypothetical protein GCM10017556_37650 [Micromonospora sagamiensis]
MALPWTLAVVQGLLVRLVLAGLVADGETVIGKGTMVDRGHADLTSRFTALGADITREEF